MIAGQYTSLIPIFDLHFARFKRTQSDSIPDNIDMKYLRADNQIPERSSGTIM